MKAETMRRKRRRIMGFTLIEVMTVATIISQIPSGAYLQAKSKAAEKACVNNLRQIGMQLQMYVQENDEYPRAAFYPKNPKTDADSIRVILGGIPEKMWICPGVPAALQEKGLTFVYNDELGGQRAVANPEKKWVLIEMTCIDPRTPDAHPAGYNVLFADGHVITTKRLPKRITDQWPEVTKQTQ